LAFGALALASFYWFAGPLVVRTATTLLTGAAGTALPWLQTVAQYTGVALAAVLAASGLHAERRYRATQRKEAAVKRAATVQEGKTQFGAGLSLKDRLAGGDNAVGSTEVTDRQSGITFQVAPDATLLEAIEGAGLKINFGCRAGVCGADAVAVCEGAEHLSPPGEDELATLRRMGLEGRARLACMCNVKGPVLIDRDPHSAPAPKVIPIAQAPQVDKARAAGLQRVVIVGNGVAGMGVADALRRQSQSLQIDIVGNEPFAFYNRMGIGRLVYDSAGLEGLLLVPPDWPDKQRVQVHRGVVATRIDREAQHLHLAGGKVLPYDRLVLATGARSTHPDEAFMKHANAFVLRSA
ncbi:MAG: FAD-dependent oxidoreductase, partial [Rubrivivax sp.]|nr:FAD-dependent oxidoreductase [Rubrivivax sp.]